MENKIEIWKDIPEYEGRYQISNLGRVKSLKWNKERILKPSKNKNDYLSVVLCFYGDYSRTSMLVHQLVAIAFLNHIPCGHKLVVNHINFDRKDNRLENLEIVTHRENGNMKHLPSSSKYTGVSFHKRDKVWQANINIKGKQKYLGSFICEEKANEAYKNAVKQITI
jgi:hypothetical protein